MHLTLNMHTAWYGNNIIVRTFPYLHTLVAMTTYITIGCHAWP